MANKTFQLAETGSCPYCGSDLIQDNRVRLTPRIGWIVTRAYECGTSLGGLIGRPLVSEVVCPRSGWLKKVA